MTLTAANTYSGGTTVTAGTLLAGNNAAFGTGAVTVGGTGVVNGGSYTLANTFAVNSGGTLTGAGTFTHAVTVASGGVLAAGTMTSAGIATFSGGVTLASGSTLVWKITSSTPSTPGTDFDQVVASAGTFAIGTATTLKLTAPTVDYTNVFWTSSHTFTFATASGTGTMTGSFATLDTSAAGNFSVDGSWSLLTGPGDSQEAVWTAATPQGSLQAVPEPSASGRIGAGATAAIAMVRRRLQGARTVRNIFLRKQKPPGVAPGRLSEPAHGDMILQQPNVNFCTKCRLPIVTGHIIEVSKSANIFRLDTVMPPDSLRAHAFRFNCTCFP